MDRVKRRKTKEDAGTVVYAPLTALWLKRANNIYRHITTDPVSDSAPIEINYAHAVAYRALQQESFRGTFLCSSERAMTIVENALCLRKEKSDFVHSPSNTQAHLAVKRAFKEVVQGIVKEIYPIYDDESRPQAEEGESLIVRKQVDGEFVAAGGQIIPCPQNGRPYAEFFKG